MRILQITQNFNTSLFSSLFEELYFLGFRQTVFYPHLTRNGSHPKTNSQIEIITRKGVPRFLRHFFVLRAIINFYNLKKSLNINNYDLIHCHTLYNDAIIGLIISLLYNKKLVISIRQSDVEIHKKKFWLRPYLFILNLRKPTFISLNPSIRNYFSFLKSDFIGNGINNKFLENENLIKKGFEKSPNVVFIGRLISRKNVDFVINNINLFNKLEIIGDNYPVTKWGEKIISKIKNNRNIIYYRQVNLDEIIQELDKNDILILPSKNETFGLVYIESLSRGLPIIYLKGTGVSGIFDLECGFEMKDISFQELSRGINYIKNNYSILSKNALLESKKFSWEKIAKQISMLYMSNLDS
jgi:glycosyltransferase involved in cell wall biosynthesis